MKDPLSTDIRLSGKSRRRARIRANHERLWGLFGEYRVAYLAAGGRTPAPFSYWLHSNTRRRQEGVPEIAGLTHYTGWLS